MKDFRDMETHLYLVVTADVNSTGVRDEYEGWLKQDDLGISDELWQSIQSWVDEYTELVRRDISEDLRLKEVEDMDQRGLRFVEELYKQLAPETKIKYFSEGLLKDIYCPAKK